jgi:hypothetical protein
MFKEVLTAKGDQEEKSERGRIRKRCHYYVAAAAAEEEGYVVYSPSKGRRNK